MTSYSIYLQKVLASRLAAINDQLLSGEIDAAGHASLTAGAHQEYEHHAGTLAPTVARGTFGPPPDGANPRGVPPGSGPIAMPDVRIAPVPGIPTEVVTTELPAGSR